MRHLALSFLLVIGFVAVGLQARQVTAAPPDPDVYNIAVLEVGDFSEWGDSTEFQELSQTPGIFTFTWTTIPTSALTTAGLAPFNVLIVPWDHDNDWKTASAISAIVPWVDGGGTLIVHALDNAIGPVADPLFAGFGAEYAVHWASANGDVATVIDPANPLVSFPNTLTSSDLSGWGESFHNFVDTFGSAWKWAATGTDDPGGDPDPAVNTAEVLGCASYGVGSMVLSGLDPETHGDGGSNPGTFLLIENEIVVNRQGICAGVLPVTLTISKSCPNGAGDGDADFNVLVTQLEDTIAADALDCGELMIIADLPAGSYTIRELITGPDANNFQTAIVCTTEEGQTFTPGTLATVLLEGGLDMECLVINVFDETATAPTDPGAPAPCGCSTVIVPIDLDNTNDNALNNNNINDNNNENTNTQDQSNEQTQTNDNNQTTTVNSSPSVVIDFD